MPYGRQLLSTSIINDTTVSADGNPYWKPGGMTIDLTTIATAPVADVTLQDGSIIRAGSQYLRYGQVMTKVGVAEVQTVIQGGTVSGGTYTLTLPASGSEAAQTTTALVFNATIGAVQAALLALPRIAAGGVLTVTGSAASYTVTFPPAMGNVPQLTSTNSLTGSSPTIAHATTTQGLSGAGKFGPYDSAASDGRAVLQRGECYILNQTWLYNPAGPGFVGVGASDMWPGIEGGLVFKERILHSGVTAHSLILGPTFAELLAAFPLLRFAEN